MSTDRTQEFLRLAASIPPPASTSASSSNGSRQGSALSNRRNGNSSNTAAVNPSSTSLALRSFHGTASGISRDIAATSQLLAELTKLVRRRGLFTEEADNAKVNDLIVVIKQNVQDLNLRLDDAAELIAKEKPKRGVASQPVQEASNLVGSLQEKFAEATNGFKEVLQQRSDRIKENNDWKENHFGGKKKDGQKLHLGPKPAVFGSKKGTFQPAFQQLNLGIPTVTPPSNGTRSTSIGSISAGEGTAQLPRPGGVAGEGGGSLYTPGLRNRNSAPVALTPIEIKRMEAENGNEQMMQLIPDQSYLQDRADQMSQVEENIVELGTIFNKLAVMVNEHKDMVQRIEDNAEEANTSIQDSLFQLTSTLESLRTNRALAMKISGILILFVILFVTVFA